jgi:hypothetical protein
MLWIHFRYNQSIYWFNSLPTLPYLTQFTLLHNFVTFLRANGFFKFKFCKMLEDNIRHVTNIIKFSSLLLEGNIFNIKFIIEIQNYIKK